MNRVIVKVTGEQKDAAGDISRIEMTAMGEHYFRNGKHYIIYEDTSLAEGAPASTMLKVAADSLTLTRRGAVEQKQRFSPESESRSRYRTPFGDLDLCVATQRLDIAYGSVSGRIDVSYDMHINGEWQSANELHIEVEADASELQKLS